MEQQAYVKYNGTASEAKQIAVSTRHRIYLPLVLKY